MELHLNIDVRKSDQIVRGATSLPHQHKALKVLVFANGADAEVALASGADAVGTPDTVDEFLARGGKKKAKSWDVIVSTTDAVRALGRVSRLLGPRGLMPTAKAGTLVESADLAEVVRRVKRSYVPYRAERAGIVGAGVAKVSMDIDSSLAYARLTKEDSRTTLGRESSFVKRAYVKSSMSRAVPLSVRELLLLS